MTRRGRPHASARPAPRRAGLARAAPGRDARPRGAPGDGPAARRLQRIRPVRAVAPPRPPRADLRAPPPPAPRRPAGRPRRRGDRHDRRPVRHVGRTEPARSRHDRRERRRDPGPARAVPRLLARPERGHDGQQPRLARRDLDARLPARRRQALHGAVHAGQGLGRERLDAGLSYTEFSYMLLQAADFQHLYRTMGVEAQIGGADQWGNITAGLELIRRASRPHGRGRTRRPSGVRPELPAAPRPEGRKFGKTSAGTSVWLDPARTSPYAFYQFLIDPPDTEVGKLLRLFTIIDRAEIEGLEAEQAAHPETRPAQRALAIDLTTRVHGVAETERAMTVSHAAFSRRAGPRSGRPGGDVRGPRPRRPAPGGPRRRRPPGRHRERAVQLERRGAAGDLPGRLLDQRRAGRRAGRSGPATRSAATWLLLRAGRKRLRIVSPSASPAGGAAAGARR